MMVMVAGVTVIALVVLAFLGSGFWGWTRDQWDACVTGAGTVGVSVMLVGTFLLVIGWL